MQYNVWYTALPSCKFCSFAWMCTWSNLQHREGKWDELFQYPELASCGEAVWKEYSTCLAIKRMMNLQLNLLGEVLCSHLLQTFLNEGKSLLMIYFLWILFSNCFFCFLSNIEVFSNCIVWLSRIMLHLTFTLSKNSTKIW